LSEQLQLRSGTASQIAAFTGASAECVVDTTNNRLVINDGVTPGGWAAGLERRTPVASTNYTVLPTDRIVAFTSLNSSCTVSLPTASSYPTGARLMVIDESGACSTTNTITIIPNGTNTINGVNGSIVLNTAYGHATLESNGSGGWAVVDGYPPAAQLLAESVHGTYVAINIVEMSVTMSGSPVTVSGFIPANCIVIALTARVTSTISGSSGITGWSCGTPGNAFQFGGGGAPGIGLGIGTTNYGLIGPTAFYTPATNVVLAPIGGTTFTGGAVRLALVYLSFSASTS
jgi:hypothetical protein